jgi:phosphoribosylformylglycinamidine cyclo-ligase
VVRDDALPDDAHGAFEQGAKGVDGGAVRLVGTYDSGTSSTGGAN